LSEQPRKRSIKAAATKEAFDKGLSLLKEADSISDPDLREAAKKAAFRYLISDSIVLLSPSTVLWFATLSGLTEVGICIWAILRLGLAVAGAVVTVSLVVWLILVAIALALAGKMSERVFSKFVLTVAGKLMDKASKWRSG